MVYISLIIPSAEKDFLKYIYQLLYINANLVNVNEIVLTISSITNITAFKDIINRYFDSYRKFENQYSKFE